MKTIRIIRAIWETPTFFLIKIPTVYVLLNWFLHIYNDLSFNWSDEFYSALSYTFLILLIYCIVCAFPYLSLDTSPLFLREEITKKIKLHHVHHQTFVDTRGVYILNRVEIKDGKMVHSYRPVYEPQKMLGVVFSQKNILDLLGSMEAEKLIVRLEIIERELAFMIENPNEINSFIK